MHDKQTKIITKKLRSGNLDFLFNTYDRLKDEGWVKSNRARNDGFVDIVYMEKEVYIDSTEPDKSETNCRPISGMPYKAVEYPLLEDQDRDDSELTSEQEIVLIKAEEGLEPREELEQIIETNVNNTAEIELPPEEHVDLSEPVPEMFEKRPYTAEELKGWNWPDLTKLGGLLGAGIGSRDKREANIVAMSLAQWGSSDA